MLRPIGGLLTFNQIFEKIVVQMVIEDMRKKLDPSQFGNQKGIGIQHYLVRLLHRIQTGLDKKTNNEVYAAICLFIDWRQAYSRQSHTLGVQSFIKNGVRPALIPLLISYFENRDMRVKWHGKISKPQNLPGSGTMGSSLGNWEFLSQANQSADCVPLQDRFKFIDDLTVLELINLINIGISSINVKHQIPNDIPTHNQYIDSKYLKTQSYLQQINKWSDNQQMCISEKKTKAMIINFSRNHQFTPRLNLKGQTMDIVNKIKILGTILNDK